MEGGTALELLPREGVNPNLPGFQTHLDVFLCKLLYATLL